MSMWQEISLSDVQWYTRGRNFWLKKKVFSLRPSVSAAEYKGWIRPNVFRNRLLPNNAEQLLFVHENIANVTKNICSNVNFLFNLNTKGYIKD